RYDGDARAVAEHRLGLAREDVAAADDGDAAVLDVEENRVVGELLHFDEERRAARAAIGRPPGFGVAAAPSRAAREASRIAVLRRLSTFARAFSPLILDMVCFPFWSAPAMPALS